MVFIYHSVVDIIMREVLSEEDITQKLKYENKIDGHLDILHNSLSRDDKNRIQSLKKNLKEKTILQEKIGCNQVICEESRRKCLRCETCFCNAIEETKPLVMQKEEEA